MKNFSLTYLADHVLLRELHTLVAQDRSTTAALIAHLGEVDERGLYRAKAYSSMHLFCVGELGMSEDVAYKSIRAARASRLHPSILHAIAEGRLHVASVVLLAPYLRSAGAAELIAAAERKTRAQVEQLLAARFPQGDVPTVIRSLATQCAEAEAQACAQALAAPDPTRAAVHDSAASTTPVTLELAPGPVAPSTAPDLAVPMGPLPERPSVSASNGSVSPVQPVRLRPLSPGRYALQVTVSDRTHALLQRARDLLGHVPPRPEVADILERALQEFVERLERRKFGLGVRARRPSGGSTSARHIPAKLKRAVHARDGGRCTFQADNGRRCEATESLEFDHVKPVARGGRTTLDNLRLRCRAHNQYEAERTYGAGFMQEKRGTRRGA